MILKNGNKNQLQQGDVLIEKINDDFFNNVKEKKEIQKSKKGFVLAHGESGHCHIIDDKQKNIELFEYYDDELKEKCLLLKILDKQALLKHEEHNKIILRKGLYKISKLNEYDPFEKFTRKVKD